MRFDIAQIREPVALAQAKESLRSRLATHDVPTDVIDQLLVKNVWDVVIKTEHDEERNKAARKAFGKVDAKVGTLCAMILETCVSTRMLSAIEVHKDYDLEMRSQSLKGNMGMLIQVIFELINTIEGFNNTPSVLACSLFSDPMLDGDNLAKFARDKQMVYETFRRLHPKNAKGKDEFESIVVTSILDCHILTQQQYPICCEVEEILQLPTAVRPTTFDVLRNVMSQLNAHCGPFERA